MLGIIFILQTDVPREDENPALVNVPKEIDYINASGLPEHGVSISFPITIEY